MWRVQCTEQGGPVALSGSRKIADVSLYTQSNTVCTRMPTL